MKIKVTSVHVDDQEKALRFYTDVLGFVKKADFSQGPFRWLTVASPEDPDGTELQLALNNNPAAKAYQQAMFQQGQPAAMFFTDDVQAEYEWMKVRGAEFTMPPTDVTGSKIAMLNDTCGNLIQVTQLSALVGRTFSGHIHPVLFVMVTRRTTWDMNGDTNRQRSPLAHGPSMPRSKGIVIGFWMVTALFCLQTAFTAYAQLRLPQVAETFTHLGFPAYFRVELRWRSFSGLCCCSRRCRRGSRSGPTPASPSISVRRSSPTSRWAMARRRGAGQRARGCSGGPRYLFWRRLQAMPASV